MGFSALLRLPRPQKFFYTMSLSTGATLITLSLLLNKLSGVYGILALFTGYHLSPFQLSMYIYSILALLLTLYLTPHIRKRSPLHNLTLACFYCLDSVINAAYTAAFGVTWFLVLAQHNVGNRPASSHTTAPGAGTIDDTAGFTSPEFNVSRVEILTSTQDSVAAIGSTPAGSPATTSGVLTSESLNSIGFIITLWTIRLYFCVIMLAYARLVLRQHIAATSQSSQNTDYTHASADASLAANPFETTPGWRGKLGRAVLAISPSYWLGSDAEEAAWMAAAAAKFRRSTEAGGQAGKADAGPTERERRRRSGTGPPEPPTKLQQGQGIGLSVPLQNL